MKLLVHRYLKLWGAFFSNSLTREMEFKANFISHIVVDLIYYISLYLFYYVIFQFTNTIGSFTKETVIIFMVVTYMIDAVYEFFFSGNIYSFNQMIVKGNLDFILTKPVNSQFLLSLRYIGFNGAISFSILTALLVFLTTNYPHNEIKLINYILFFISFIIGNIIWYSIDFMIHCLSFWFKNFSVAGWLGSNIKQFSMRPDTIYGGFLRKILFSFFPMAMIASVPVRFLIFGYDFYLLLAQGLIGLVFFCLARHVWTISLIRYESASS
tara:strand:+ start:3817 stop:4620 length:804 start_codon:yes stop_codon:yes gene_type:complete